MNPFVQTITSQESTIRNLSFYQLCKNKSLSTLLKELEGLEFFRQQTSNLYERVRASLFLYAAYRFVLPDFKKLPTIGLVPPEGLEHLMSRRFEEAIMVFRKNQHRNCLLYTSPSPRDATLSRMPSSA